MPGDDPTVADDGAALARVLGVPATLLRVVSPRRAIEFDERGKPSLESTRVELRGRAARLEAASGAEVTSWATTGELRGILLGLASDPRVLVCVGRRTPPQRVGRLVSALLHQAAGPVLVVPEPSHGA